MIRTCFNFDKNQMLIFFYYEIDFTKLASVVSANYDVTGSYEEFEC
ncbi:MAG TPA: hypothetical protein PL188_10210 [Candidatus Cloacimonadota bacterium]|nr:hypothetical protein [Candidatus Cloacimonadota bacterium]